MDVLSSEAMKTAYDLGAALAPAIDTPNGGKAIVVPGNYKLEQIAPLELPLTRIRQSVTLFDTPSFVAYVNRFKTDNTRIFAEPGFIADGGKAIITAVFDYHGGPATPDRLGHKAIYRPRYSDEWTVWSPVQKLAQVAFAEFVEENRADITEPSAAQMLDLIRTFKATRKIDYDSVVYNANGDVTLGYSEKSEASGAKGTTTVMPEKVKIGIPVYFRGPKYAIEIFIRYRVNPGAVVFELKPDRVDIIENAAFTELCTDIGKEVGIDPYLGRVG